MASNPNRKVVRKAGKTLRNIIEGAIGGLLPRQHRPAFGVTYNKHYKSSDGVLSRFSRSSRASLHTHGSHMASLRASAGTCVSLGKATRQSLFENCSIGKLSTHWFSSSSGGSCPSLLVPSTTFSNTVPFGHIALRQMAFTVTSALSVATRIFSSAGLISASGRSSRRARFLLA
jgi:hypothetical protein